MRQIRSATVIAATAVLLLAGSVAADTPSTFSGSASDADTPTPQAWGQGDFPASPKNMAGTPQRPSPERFVHYVYDSTQTKLTRQDMTQNTYNPKMAYGGASIANREDGMEKSGWDMTYVMTEKTSTAKNTQKAFYAAGYAEGYETQHRIYQNFINIFPPTWTDKYTGSWAAQCNQTCEWFIRSQFDWMSTTADDKVKELAKQTGTYEYKFWSAVQDSVAQINGMIDGYMDAAGVKASTSAANETLTWAQIYGVGFDFELGDVQHWVHGYLASHNEKQLVYGTNKLADHPDLTVKYPPVDPETGKTVPMPPKRMVDRNAHCSALIKATDSELFMAHDTWSGYNTMLRQYKTYEFGDQIPAISMSSYPGTLHSGDDWYMMSNGISSQETTNANNNNASKGTLTPRTVPEFVRVMVANRVAVDGSSWTQLFGMYNSGTYNNQYMVVDHNKFDPSKPKMADKIGTGTLWIVEQMPGKMAAADVSAFLVNQTYWASYNIPFLLNNDMKYPELVKSFGSFFDYNKYARPEIFKANQGGINSVHDMKMMMRWNDYQTSKYSTVPKDNCKLATDGANPDEGVCDPAQNPQLVIANRADLAATYTLKNGGPIWGFLTQNPFGAIDSKIVSSNGIKQMMGHMISGPTSTPYAAPYIEPFNWDGSAFKNDPRRNGMPNQYDFDFCTSAELVSDNICDNKLDYLTDYNPRYAGKFAPYQGFMLGVLIAVLGLAVYIFISKKNNPDDYNPMTGQ